MGTTVTESCDIQRQKYGVPLERSVRLAFLVASGRACVVSQKTFCPICSWRKVDFPYLIVRECLFKGAPSSNTERVVDVTSMVEALSAYGCYEYYTVHLLVTWCMLCHVFREVIHPSSDVAFTLESDYGVSRLNFCFLSEFLTCVGFERDTCSHSK